MYVNNKLGVAIDLDAFSVVEKADYENLYKVDTDGPKSWFRIWFRGRHLTYEMDFEDKAERDEVFEEVVKQADIW